jgi:hypothetical protein
MQKSNNPIPAILQGGTSMANARQPNNIDLMLTFIGARPLDPELVLDEALLQLSLLIVHFLLERIVSEKARMSFLSTRPSLCGTTDLG